MRTLKKLTGTCKLTNKQLNESLRDRFICGLHSEQIKQKLLSRNFTFQEAVDTAIAQESAHKGVRDIGGSHGEESDERVNKVQRDDFLSCSRGSRPSGRHDAGVQGRAKPKRCNRCGLTNHTQKNCRHKNAECYRCHKTGHLQSECRSTGPSYRKGAENQHVRHTDQDPEETEDEFLGSIFGVNESSQSKTQGSEISTPRY